MIPRDPKPDPYTVVMRSLRYCAIEARQAGMFDAEDEYLTVLVDLIAGDVDVVPQHRLVR